MLRVKRVDLSHWKEKMKMSEKTNLHNILHYLGHFQSSDTFVEIYLFI